MDSQHPTSIMQTLDVPRRVPRAPVDVPQHVEMSRDIICLNIITSGKTLSVLEEVNISEVPRVLFSAGVKKRHHFSPVFGSPRNYDLVRVIDSDVGVSK